MDNFQIQTAQNINISQNVAGVGERILAYLIDGVIMVIYIFGVIYAFSFMQNSLLESGSMLVFAMASMLPIMLYHLLWEVLWDGKSPGKAVLQLRVVMLDGSKPAFSNYFIRWILRFVDINISSGAVAVVFVLLNGKGQRLGDMAASTAVISEKSTINFSQTILMDLPVNYVPTYPQVTIFADSEIQTIKTLFFEAKNNGNHNVILKLAHQVADVMQIQPEQTPIKFLDTVISDYNFYTQSL